MPILRINQQPGDAPNRYRIDVSAVDVPNFQPQSGSRQIEFESPCTIPKPTRRPWWRPCMVSADFLVLFGRVCHEYQYIIVRLVTHSWMSHTSRHYRPLPDRWSAA
jgi:hypothetical protein